MAPYVHFDIPRIDQVCSEPNSSLTGSTSSVRTGFADVISGSTSTSIDQAYILFRARLAAPFTFGAGEETQEAAMFSPEDIPFSEVRRCRMPTQNKCAKDKECRITSCDHLLRHESAVKELQVCAAGCAVWRTQFRTMLCSVHANMPG